MNQLHHSLRVALTIFFLVLALDVVWSQKGPTPPPDTVEDRQTTILESLARLITGVEQGIEELKKARRAANLSAPEQLQLAGSIAQKEESLRQLKVEFLSIATKIEIAEADETEKESLTLQEEIRELISPVLGELKDATFSPRKLEALRRKISALEAESANSQKILEALNTRLTEDRAAEVKSHLTKLRDDWQARHEETGVKLEIARSRFAELDQDTGSVLDKTSTGIQSFFRNRGKHLLFALLGFLLTFFLVRRGYAIFRKLNPIHRKKGQSLYVRAFDLAFNAAAFLFALVVFVFILYMANDWVLLLVALLFIGGITWGGKQAFPRFYEQGKLMLNLGPVREGERVIYDGVPWKVGKIHLYTNLTNPALKGGLIRLPIRELMELHSRPHQDELWFPTQKENWVLLSDDTFGKVVEHTPEYVQILKLGGARKIIPASTFRDLNPENLSNNFRISSVFGIDYQHQEICTTEVPGIFQQALQEELAKIVGEELINNVSVQFSAAAASSLDYEILIDFAGEAAPKYRMLRRTVQRLCVDVCNAQGWVIPFAQLTVHQAEAS